MKKLWMFFLCMIMMTACTAEVENTIEEEVVTGDTSLVGEIEFVNWLIDNPGAMETIVAGFNEDYPNIRVKLTTLPFNEVREHILARNSAGIPADVYLLNMPWVSELVEGAMILPLDDYINTDATIRREDLVQEPMQPINGSTYMVPLSMMHFLLYCNEAHFEEAGIEYPTSWESLREAAVTLTDQHQDRYGMSMSMSSSGAENGPPLMLYPLLYSTGGRTIKDGAPNIDTPEMLSLMTFVDDLYATGAVRPGTLTKDGTHVIDDFANGYASMMIQPAVHIETIRDMETEVRFDVVRVPGPENNNVQATRLHGFELGISATSESPDLAWVFISWMLRPENNSWIAQTIGQMPANLRADTSYLQDDVLLQKAYAMMRDLELVEEMMYTPRSTDTWRVFTDYTQQMFLDEISPEQAVKGIQKEWEVIFSE